MSPAASTGTAPGAALRPGRFSWDLLGVLPFFLFGFLMFLLWRASKRADTGSAP